MQKSTSTVKSSLKYSHAILIILFVLAIDQITKIYVKTHFYAGEEVFVIGTWFRLHFLENEGMAFGMKLSQTDMGKLFLSLFRLIAVVIGFFILKKIVAQKYSNGAIICGSLLLAGALGNLIDSMFYGLIFTESYPAPFQGMLADHAPKAQLVWGHGYGRFLHGKVVDMLYFPMVQTRLPDWIPLIGGRQFEFFEPVFNIADAAISVSILTGIFFQKKLMRKQQSVLLPETAAGQQSSS
jgi:signal peptidase II